MQRTRREAIGVAAGGVAAVALGSAFRDDLFGSASSAQLRPGTGYGPRRPANELGLRLPEGFRSRLVAHGGEAVPRAACPVLCIPS